MTDCGGWWREGEKGVEKRGKRARREEEEKKRTEQNKGKIRETHVVRLEREAWAWTACWKPGRLGRRTESYFSLVGAEGIDEREPEREMVDEFGFGVRTGRWGRYGPCGWGATEYSVL